MSSAATCVSINNFSNLSLKMEDEVGVIGVLTTSSQPPLAPTLNNKVMMSIEKQGIVSILGSDNTTERASIRRTLSADMSSKKWLSQNGYHKIAISCVDDNNADSQDDVWRSIIQNNNMKKDDESETRTLGVWSSIVSQKNDDQDASKLPPSTYIHPLVKRSSSLSGKSLEICTESLGSETGSDGFSSYTPSENGDLDEENKHEQQQQQQQQQQFSSNALQTFEDFPVVKYNYCKRSSSSSPRSFPPPLPSLARGDKPSLHMQSHRQNGRLILEVVSVPPRNYFHAQRHDGRLLLTCINNQNDPTTEPEFDTEDQVQEFEEVFDDIQELEDVETPHLDDSDDEEEEDDDDDEDEDEDGEQEMGIVMEKNPRLSSGVINVNKSALMMLEKKNHITWYNKFNKAVNHMIQEDQEDSIVSIPQSLPPPHRVAHQLPAGAAAATSFNAYEYFWRKKPISMVYNPITMADQCKKYNPQGLENNCCYYSNNQVVVVAPNGTASNAKSTTKVAAYEQQDLVLVRGNNANMNNLVPLFRGCKEPRRSLLMLEPYCIATS